MIFPPMKPDTVKSIKVKIIVEMTNTITILNCKAEEMTMHLNWNPYTKEVTFEKPLKIEGVEMEEK